MDWWAAFGLAGRIEVAEPLSPEAAQRRLTADPDVDVALGRAELPGLPIDLAARGRTRSARSGSETLGMLDFSGPPDLTGGFHRPLTLLGHTGEVVRRTAETRRSRLRGSLRYLSIAAGPTVRVWHYLGGRAAGERLVLCAGERPGSTPLVVTHPSAHGRALGNPTGGATGDTHVTSWSAEARPADVLLVELLASAWLGVLVDYRPTRVVEGFSELLGVLPRPDANTE